MSIRLLDYRAVQLVFKPSAALIEYLDSLSDEKVELPAISYNAIFPEEKENEFLIHFEFDLNESDEEKTNNDESGRLRIDFIARFISDTIIEQKFKDSHFPRVNAPAIAYPFLRAFVNNFFINAGYNPVLLPTYNFTKSFQEKDNVNAD